MAAAFFTALADPAKAVAVSAGCALLLELPLDPEAERGVRRLDRADGFQRVLCRRDSGG